MLFNTFLSITHMIKPYGVVRINYDGENYTLSGDAIDEQAEVALDLTTQSILEKIIKINDIVRQKRFGVVIYEEKTISGVRVCVADLSEKIEEYKNRVAR